MTTRSWTGSCSVSVRATHSSPSGGATKRASARRASDTTLAKVASRTSRSHSAVRAPVLVARSRWVVSQAISSTVFDRSKLPASPVRACTSTAPISPTTISCGRGSKRDVGGPDATSSAPSAHWIASTGSSGSSGRSASTSSSLICSRSDALTPTGTRSIDDPNASRLQAVGTCDQPRRCGGHAPEFVGDDDGHAVARRGQHAGTAHLGAVVGRAEQDDSGLPHLAAGTQRPQLERRSLVDRRGADQGARQLDGGVGRARAVGAAVVQQRGLGQRHGDEMSDLGEQRRRQCRGDRRDDLVGLIGSGGDREHSARLEIDEQFVARRRHPELHQGHARLADLSCVVAEDLDGHLGAEPPRLAIAGPRQRQHGGRRQAEVEIAVG